MGNESRHDRTPQTGLVREFAGFLLHNKKWWLVPILVVLLLICALVILARAGSTRFLYMSF